MGILIGLGVAFLILFLIALVMELLNPNKPLDEPKRVRLPWGWRLW